MNATITFGRNERRALTTLHNHGGSVTLPAGAKTAAYSPLVAAGWITITGTTLAITPAGEARLLDRSDVSAADEARIAREAMAHHGRE